MKIASGRNLRRVDLPHFSATCGARRARASEREREGARERVWVGGGRAREGEGVGEGGAGLVSARSARLGRGVRVLL